MSHYYHIYPGTHGVYRPGNGVEESEGTDQFNFSTPPPPGEDRYPARTPEGVFTQVQRSARRSPLLELNLQDGDNVSYLSESEVLDYSRDRACSQPSNLTGIFPRCSIGDRKGNRGSAEDESSKNVPDFLTKVLTHTSHLNTKQLLDTNSQQEFRSTECTVSSCLGTFSLKLPPRQDQLSFESGFTESLG